MARLDILGFLHRVYFLDLERMDLLLGFYCDCHSVKHQGHYCHGIADNL